MLEKVRPDGVRVKLRPLADADESLLKSMLYHAIHVPEVEAPPSPEIVEGQPLRRYYEGWGREGDGGLVAEVEGIAVGAAWLRMLTGERRGYGWVADDVPELSIAVLPDFRRLGIGTRLLVGLLFSLPPGCRRVSLSVSKDNPAVRLYRRFGFETVADDGTTLTMVGPG